MAAAFVRSGGAVSRSAKAKEKDKKEDINDPAEV